MMMYRLKHFLHRIISKAAAAMSLDEDEYHRSCEMIDAALGCATSGEVRMALTWPTLLTHTRKGMASRPM